MAAGGNQVGAGRPQGAKNKIAAYAIEKAKQEGMLPHEMLLMIARGEAIPHTYQQKTLREDGVELIETVKTVIYADFDTRVDAMKACAQFYAPKLSAVQVRSVNPQGQISTVDEEDLDEMLTELRADIALAKKKANGNGKNE